MYKLLHVKPRSSHRLSLEAPRAVTNTSVEKPSPAVDLSEVVMGLRGGRSIRLSPRGTLAEIQIRIIVALLCKSKLSEVLLARTFASQKLHVHAKKFICDLGQLVIWIAVFWWPNNAMPGYVQLVWGIFCFSACLRDVVDSNSPCRGDATGLMWWSAALLFFMFCQVTSPLNW